MSQIGSRETRVSVVDGWYRLDFNVVEDRDGCDGDDGLQLPLAMN